MMSGQILAGADPVTATGYQIVVMLMVAAATALGSLVALLLTYRRRFTADGVFLRRAFASRVTDDLFGALRPDFSASAL